MNEQKYKELMEELRTLYRNRDFKKLKERYLLSKWLLTEQDKKNIEKVIYIATSEEPSILEFAQKEMGGTISPIDK
jgi:hypothetical protein